MKNVLLLLMVSVSLSVQAGWIDKSGKSLADTESMRSADNFAVQMVLTPDEQQFRHIWNTAKDTPSLTTTDTIRAGDPVSAVIIFHGCSVNAAGVCDVVSEFVLEMPDGSSMPAGHGPVWSAPPLGAGLLQLGLASMTVVFDASDVPGEYKVRAHILDQNSGQSLSLVARFQLVK